MKKDTNESQATSFRQKAEELLKKKSEAKILELIEELAFQNEEKAKRADELLIANKELTFQKDNLRKIASRVPGVVYQYLLRPDGTSCFPYASEAIREIYRVSPEQVREDASAVFANLHPDDLAVVAASIQASAQNLTPWQHEYRVKFSDGTIRLLYGNAVPQREEDGSVLWHGFITDITDLYSQKKALLELQKSEEKFQAIANYAASWEARFNPEGKLVWMNPYSEILTGYTPEEYIAAEDYLSMVIAAEDIEMVLEKFQEALQGISGNDMETRINRRDGSKFWASVSWRPIFDLNGRSLGFRTSTKDISQRKKAEELLRESEEKHRILFMDSPDAYLIIIDGVIVDCNRATEVMLRGDRLRIIGQTPDALSPEIQPDGRKSTESALQKINDTLRTGRNSFEWVHQRFDGSHFTVEVSAASMMMGVKTALFIAWRDISDRKQAEIELKENEIQYRNLADSGMALIWKSGTDKLCNYFNKPWLKFTGRTIEQEMGNGWAEGVHPDDFEHCLKTYIEAFDKREMFKMEYRLRNANGEYKWLLDLGTPNYSINNEFVGYIGHCFDISELKHAEESLRESEQKYRLLAENTKDVIWILDPVSMCLSYASPSVENLLGYTPEELMTIPFEEILIPEIRKPFLQLTQQRVENFLANPESKTSFQNEVMHLRKNGSTVITEVVNQYYQNKTTGKVEIQGVSREITERKKADTEIKQKNEELIKLNLEKDKFFSIIAHDLRGPFNGFLGFTELMAEELSGLTQVEIQKMAVSMRNSATNLFRLLENLLEWSRLQRGITTFEPGPFLLMPIIAESMNPLKDSANKKEIEIRYEIPSDLEVFADEYMLGSIIRNLASNAVKFTRKGGNVTIAAKTVAGNSVEISVRDTGIGIGPELVNDLFRLDVQTNRRGTEDEPSTGLGLIICKDFIEKHDGKLWVESEEGKGSTFYFTLPASLPRE